MESKINVMVRVKPNTAASLWQIVDNTLISHKKEQFTFDTIFDQHVSTEQIFQENIKALVLNALQGVNQTVFAYGQTCSGKTFTMRGDTD